MAAQSLIDGVEEGIPYIPPEKEDSTREAERKVRSVGKYLITTRKSGDLPFCG